MESNVAIEDIKNGERELDTEIKVENNEGTSVVCSLGEDGKIKKSTSNEISDLSELKEYISKNKDNIKSVSSKKGSYNNKISLADFIKREFNTTNYNSNPEKLGEDLILSLIKPMKILSNFISQSSKGKEEYEPNKSKDLLEKRNDITIEIDNKLFFFKGYNEDFSKLIVEKEKGIFYELDNNKSFILSNPPEKSFTSVELDLLAKGKTLIVSSQNPPFKIMQENGQHKYMTLSKDDFTKNLSQKERNKRSQKEKIKI